MRATVKRHLIAAYCNGFAPAWFVSIAFKAFRLKHQ